MARGMWHEHHCTLRKAVDRKGGMQVNERLNSLVEGGGKGIHRDAAELGMLLGQDNIQAICCGVI